MNPEDFRGDFEWIKPPARKDEDSCGFYRGTFKMKRFLFPYITLYGRIFRREKKGWGMYELDREHEKKTVFKWVWYKIIYLMCWILGR